MKYVPMLMVLNCAKNESAVKVYIYLKLTAFFFSNKLEPLQIHKKTKTTLFSHLTAI